MKNWLRPLFAAIVTILSIGAASAQGVIPIALQQSVNQNGQPLAGCLLYIFQVGTVATPQNAFSDSGLTLPLSNPLVCDSNGRLPMFYLASGSVHVRLTDASGIVQFDYPSMLVIGAAGGGGGAGGSVDPTAIAATGDVKFRPTSESLTGWVKLNAQSIGSATSGATGRANADTQALYVYEWNNCPNAHCAVSSGRGASGLADFQANKTLTLPDWRSRVPLGLADMGNTSCSAVRADCLLAANITSGGGDGVTTPGATGGQSNHTLLVAEVPNLTVTVSGTPSGTVSISDTRGLSTPSVNTGTVASSGVAFASSAAPTGSITTSFSGGSITGSFAGNALNSTGSTFSGGGGAHNVLSPFMLGTFYIKL